MSAPWPSTQQAWAGMGRLRKRGDGDASDSEHQEERRRSHSQWAVVRCASGGDFEERKKVEAAAGMEDFKKGKVRGV